MKQICIPFLIFSILVCGGISGCLQQQKNIVPEQTDGMVKGVSLSPRSFEATDFTAFWNFTQQTGFVVSWAGDWNELSDTENGSPVVVASLVTVSSYRYVPVIEAQLFTQSNGTLLRPLNGTNKQRYKDSAVAFATAFKPRYLAFGIEVNALYEKSPQDFEEFVALFDETSLAVKAVSPETTVFTIFQLEKMKGLNGGLFGGSNDPTKSEWSLLEYFPSVDIIGFTTYPGLIYKDLSEIPTDYYTEIQLHTNKTIAFTEIGWASKSSIAGWESSEAKQAAFVTKFFTLTQEIDPTFVIWSFMYDQQTIEPFTSMGLRHRDGSAKPSWDAWIQGGSDH